MPLPHVNSLAILVATVAIFVLGGLWYSPALFAKRWIALQGKSEEEMKAAAAGSPMPVLLLMAFVCALLISSVLAVILNHFANMTALRGAMAGGVCYIGFAGATSFANAIFSMKPKQLWLIDSGYNLVSFLIAGLILGAWR